MTVNFFEVIRRVLVEGESVESAVADECNRRARAILPLVVDLLRSLSSNPEAESSEDSAAIAKARVIAYDMIQHHRAEMGNLPSLMDELNTVVNGTHPREQAHELFNKLLPEVVPDKIVALVRIVKRGIVEACEQDEWESEANEVCEEMQSWARRDDEAFEQALREQDRREEVIDGDLYDDEAVAYEVAWDSRRR